MAELTQSVPNIEPANYLGWPKDIQKPDFVSPFAIAAKDLGEGIKGAAQEGVKAVGEFAENLGRDLGKNLAGNYGQAVEKLHSGMFPQDWEDAKGNIKDTLTPGADAVPPALKQGMDSVKNTQAAKDQGSTPGHLRETMYLRDLYLQASDLRRRFPGFENYIDKGISDITGMTPTANHYLKSMLADINELMTKKNSGDNHDRNIIATAAGQGDPNALKEYTHIQNGTKTVAQAFSDYGKSNFITYQTKMTKDNLENMKGNDEMLQAAAADHVRGSFVAKSNRSMQDWLFSKHLTPDVLKAVGEGKMSFEDIGINPRDLAQAMTQQKLLERQREDRELDEPTTIGGVKTTLRRAGKKDIEEIQGHSLDGWDMFIKALNDPNHGGIDRIANAVKDAENNMKLKIWDGPDGTAAQLRSFKAYQDFGGMNLTPSLIGRPGFETLSSVKDIEALVGSAGSRSTLRGKGLDGVKESLASLNKSTGGDSKMNNAYLSALAELVGHDKVDGPAKLNVLDHLFDTKETGWMGDIREDGKSLGRHEIFAKFANPKFAASVEKVAHDYAQPDLVDKYQNFIRNEFGQHLFRTDISNLPDYKNYPGVQLTWQTPKGEAPQFKADPAAGRYLGGSITQGQAERRADALNSGLTKLNAGIKAMYGVFGERTGEMLLQEFRTRGLDTSDSKSMAGQLLLSVVNHKPLSTDEPTWARKSANEKPSQVPSSGGNPSTGFPLPGGAVTQDSAEAAKPGSFLYNWLPQDWNTVGSRIKSRMGM